MAQARINRVKKIRNFTDVDNDLLQNSSLSWEARGLATYLLSLPVDWQINVVDLINRSPKCKRDKTRAIFAELELQGYVSRSPRRDAGGRIIGRDYFVYESIYDNPHFNAASRPGFSGDGFSGDGEATTTNNTVFLTNLNNNDKNNSESSLTGNSNKYYPPTAPQSAEGKAIINRHISSAKNVKYSVAYLCKLEKLLAEGRLEIPQSYSNTSTKGENNYESSPEDKKQLAELTRSIGREWASDKAKVVALAADTAGKPNRHNA